MAEYYCDISAVGNEYQAYADTVTTWGVPQDGNGEAQSAASAAVAIAVIDCTSATAAGAGTIGILGVTVSSTLTGSGTTLAASLVTAINGTATAVGTTYSKLLLPLNKLVWARQNPGSMGQVQVMMRIAGDSWNAINPTKSGFSPDVSLTAFTGGVDGPFGYLLNGATVFGKTLGTYGLWVAASPGATEPAVTEQIHCRTRRSGADLSFTFSTASALTMTWKARNYLFDNGTVWSGDNGKLTANIRHTAATGVTVEFVGVSSSAVAFVSRGTENFEINVASTVSSVGVITVFGGQGLSSAAFAFIGCRFVEHSSNLSPNMVLFRDGGSTSTALSGDFSNSFVQLRATAKQFIMVERASSTVWTRTNGMIVEVVAASGVIGYIASVAQTGAIGRFEWIGGEIRDTNGVYRCTMPVSVPAGIVQFEVVLDGVVGITDAVIGLTPSPASNVRMFWNSPEGPNKAFRLETPQFVTDWKGNGTFPHCGELNLQGVGWSHRVTWNSVPSRNNSVTPLKLSYFYRATAATKLFEVELYCPDATTFYTDEIELGVMYLDSSDVWRVEEVGGVRGVQLIASRTALSSSSKSWTANGVANFSAKQLAITTAYPVKQDSEVTLRLSLCTSRGSALVIYVSPAPTVT